MSAQASDCCLTCWHNRRNGGRAGWPGPAGGKEHYCVLRNFPIEDAERTHCANHPLRFPRKLPLPVGPVHRTDGFGQRVVWRLSADTEEIRELLLQLLEETPETPRSEYPFGIPFDEIVSWQLGEFRERRAADGLRRVSQFDPARSDPVFGLNRFMTVRRASEALAKIEKAGEELGSDIEQPRS